MKYFLGDRSIKRLVGVHPALVAVVKRAIQITEVDFTVLEGLRTRTRQLALVRAGASQTMNSRHLAHPQDGLARAVDLGAYVGKQVRWDWPLYHKIAKAMKQAAKELEIPLEWGGDWKSFKDGPHFQLPRKTHP